MVDLRTALNCIKVMKEYGTYHGEKIGRIKKECSGMCMTYPAGSIVLFREELEPSNSQLCMGEYIGMKQRKTGRVTIESPLCQVEIDKQKAKGSLITSIGTIVYFPEIDLEEIKL